MDVKKSVKSEPKFSRFTLFNVVAGALIMALVIVNNMSEGQSASVSRGDIVLGKVKRGTFEVKVDGYGNLQWDKQQIITARSNGVVTEVLLDPGALVTPDSVLLELQDPALRQELLMARRDLNRMASDYQRELLNAKRDILDQESSLETVNADFQTAKLTKEAQEELHKNGIVSKLTFKTAVLRETQLKKQFEIQTKRYKQLEQIHQQSSELSKEDIAVQREIVDAVVQRYEGLRVKAGINGVVQQVFVTLGQGISDGEQLALIGSTDQMLAIIKVPVSKAEMIEPGQKSTIDSRTNIIEGVVQRIDPVVENNAVTVEILITDNMPANIKAETRVDVQIEINKLDDVMYVKKPANARANSSGMYYVVDKDSNTAKLTKLRFGAESDQYIQVLSGIVDNATIILQDLKDVEGEVVQIND